jgi:hypothetical protein
VIIQRRAASIAFKFAPNAVVKRGRLLGKIDSRVPCEPRPMYYVAFVNGTRELVAENDLKEA